jgi:hypothetical protein
MAFQEVVDVCGLTDLGYTGINWTFEKLVVGGSFCCVRLDRALPTTNWCSRYRLDEVQHLPAVACSDHIPILLEIVPAPDRALRKKPIFRYLTMWEKHMEFDQMLMQVWTWGECN